MTVQLGKNIINFFFFNFFFMAIFTAQLEQPADKVLDFAMYLGYTAQVIVQNDDG